VGAETRQALDNVGTLLRAVGLDFADVVKTTVYLADFDDFAVMNEVYREYFSQEPPVRFTTGVTKLLNGARVEVEVIAAR
jgi:2-iminobutanoate/2-iminopropanoate deaminase